MDLTRRHPAADVAASLLQKVGALDGCHSESASATRGVDNAENVRRIAAVPLVSHPGAAYTYGHDTDVLGRVLEVVTGETLEEVLQRRVLRPLGMNDTTFYIAPSDLKRARRLAELYHAPAGKLESCKSEFAPEWCANAQYGYIAPHSGKDGSIDHSSKESRSAVMQSGGCGLLSTASDFLKFIRMLLSGGRGAGGVRIIGRAAVHAMTYGDRLASASDYTFKNLDADLPSGSVSASEGWGLSFSLSTSVSRRPPAQLEASPVFGWGGLHSLHFFGSHGERMSGVALTQCHGFDRFCRDRSDELHRGLRDVAHSLLP